jgi:hypothetical protein
MLRAVRDAPAAVKDFDQTIKDQKARAERAREIRCNRLFQRASTGGKPPTAPVAGARILRSEIA